MSFTNKETGPVEQDLQTPGPGGQGLQTPGPGGRGLRAPEPRLQEPEGMPLHPAGRGSSPRPSLRRHTHIVNVQDAHLTHGSTMHPRQNLRLAQHPQSFVPLVPTLRSEKGQYSGKQPRGPVRMRVGVVVGWGVQLLLENHLEK